MASETAQGMASGTARRTAGARRRVDPVRVAGGVQDGGLALRTPTVAVSAARGTVRLSVTLRATVGDHVTDLRGVVRYDGLLYAGGADLAADDLAALRRGDVVERTFDTEVPAMGGGVVTFDLVGTGPCGEPVPTLPRSAVFGPFDATGSSSGAEARATPG